MKVTYGFALVLASLALASCDDDVPPRPKSPPAAAGDRAFMGTEPILAVRDLDETLTYYEEVLGFTNAWRWEDGDDYGGISRGGAWLMFDKNPKVAKHVRGHLVWFHVVGVDALYREHVAAGAKIVEPLSDRPWGFREYRVEDPNGYHLRIAERIPCENDCQSYGLGSTRLSRGF